MDSNHGIELSGCVCKEAAAHIKNEKLSQAPAKRERVHSLQPKGCARQTISAPVAEPPPLHNVGVKTSLWRHRTRRQTPQIVDNLSIRYAYIMMCYIVSTRAFFRPHCAREGGPTKLVSCAVLRAVILCSSSWCAAVAVRVLHETSLPR